MGFFGSFFGNDQRKDIETANRQATGALTQGRDAAMGQYSQAREMYSPYAQQGQRANALYGDATGANGQGAYKAAMAGYAGSDPFRDQNADYANNALMRQYAARGQSGGNAGLAVARAQTERGATDWNAYLSRLQGQGQMGLQATGAQAGLTQGMGDLQSGYGQQMAGNAINYGNAMAGSRNIGINNLMGIGGLALKAMAPTPGGFGGGGGNPGIITQNPATDLPWQNGGSVNKLFGGFGRNSTGGL